MADTADEMERAWRGLGMLISALTSTEPPHISPEASTRLLLQPRHWAAAGHDPDDPDVIEWWHWVRWQLKMFRE
ncbi:hypothetical protein [Rhodococcus aetherivorans]